METYYTKNCRYCKYCTHDFCIIQKCLVNSMGYCSDWSLDKDYLRRKREELRNREILRYYYILVEGYYSEGLILKEDLSYDSLLRHHLMSIAECMYDFYDERLG